MGLVLQADTVNLAAQLRPVCKCMTLWASQASKLRTTLPVLRRTVSSCADTSELYARACLPLAEKEATHTCTAPELLRLAAKCSEQAQAVSLSGAGAPTSEDLQVCTALHTPASGACFDAPTMGVVPALQCSIRHAGTHMRTQSPVKPSVH